jgi:hypothetical protein
MVGAVDASELARHDKQQQGRAVGSPLRFNH